jgi:hypothetical protein
VTTVLKDPNVDAIALFLADPADTFKTFFSDGLAALAQELEKPVLLSYFTGEQEVSRKVMEEMEGKGLLFYPQPLRAVNALAGPIWKDSWGILTLDHLSEQKKPLNNILGRKEGRTGTMLIEANGIKMNYELSGREGAPVVMLSHSLGSSLFMWNPQLRNRTTRFCVTIRGATEAATHRQGHTPWICWERTLSVCLTPLVLRRFISWACPWAG